MKVVNLNKFKQDQDVTLDGVDYTVRHLTVDEYMNNTVQERFKDCKDEKEKARVMIDVIGEFTTIPKEILVKQPFTVLNAIIQLIQGVDLEDDENEAEPAEKN